MNKAALFVVLALIATMAFAIQEIPMQHRKRTDRESQRLLNYLRRSTYAQNINNILAKIFPSKLTPNIYAYPEVKILNYLDAQYYGYTVRYAVKLTLERHPKNSELSSTLVHLTFGCLPKNADSLLLAIFINIMIPAKAPPMFTTEHISTLPTVQELFRDLSVKTQFGLPDSKPKMLFLLKSLLFTESASLLPSLMVFLVWPGL